MKKYAMSTFTACEVNVKMEGDLQTYALNFLKIFNTVKSNKDDLFRVTNDYNDGVQVVCNQESVETTKEYLSNFGEITSVNNVLCMRLEEDPEYDYDKYDDLVIIPWVE